MEAVLLGQSSLGTVGVPVDSKPINMGSPLHTMHSSVSSMTSAMAIPTPTATSLTNASKYATPHYPTMEPQAIGIVIFSLFAMLLLFPPLVWHVRSKNVAASSLCVWLLILNFMNVVNASIWPNDDTAHQWKGYGLCDVFSKLDLASYAALTGAVLVIIRDLCHVLNTKRITLVPSDKQRRIHQIVTGILCFGIPIFIMATHYIVQSPRYYIFTLTGCTAGTDNSWLSILLIFIWPLIEALAAAGFAILLCWRMHRYKKEFGRLLAISNTTKSRFMRLFILSGILILVLLPLQIFFFTRNMQFGITGYHWSVTHNKFWNYIIILPSFGVVSFDRWVRAGAGVLMFFFFGIGADALVMYRGWLRAIGLGKIFPAIKSDGPIKGLSWGVGSWGSMNSRARSLLKRRAKGDGSGSDVESSMPHSATGVTNGASQTDDPLLSEGKGFENVSVTRDVSISHEKASTTESEKEKSFDFGA